MNNDNGKLIILKNMKKIIFVFTLALITHASPAQKSAYNSQPERLFNLGKEMFLEGNFTGAQDILLEFTSGSSDLF